MGYKTRDVVEKETFAKAGHLIAGYRIVDGFIEEWEFMFEDPKNPGKAKVIPRNVPVQVGRPAESAKK